MTERQHIFDHKKNINRVLRALIALCVVSFAVDFVYHRHVVHPFEALWGFYAIYGFFACVILVLLAKKMRKWLMRSEDYYDRDD
ncbi:MAG: hypothetical protein HOD23_05200 [Proteobacteria bacterium]|jgi:uncharacterized membrane protein|nr:hypothetical protein [Pseudomonadota bacterium]MDB4825897.1 hypothetical protein [Gammaproteobacteria bacterium]MBT4988791.1 hypothetical protein [Pseudomonadota bacterium]MBT5190374.1 hypothetical protein [Pseudomonadota bacterium]MBT5625866.1 hypothetical protein [Pseudomonadota bacterium]